jgi:hypothetical protein
LTGPQNKISWKPSVKSSLSQPFYLGGTLEIIFKFQGNPCVKIIMKVGSGFNVDKGCIN